MNSIREIQQINDQELRLGIAGTRASWHTQYAQSAWVYVGNLDHTLTEGDVLAVLSQWGELDDVHLLREETTGESRGFAFAKYSDARSCVLCVDNFCGIPLCGRSLRVDHVEQYRLPQHILKELQEQQQQQGDGGVVDIGAATGHAYHGQQLANEYSLQNGQDLFAPAPSKIQTTTTINETEKATKQQRKEQRNRQRQEKEQRKAEREEKRRRHRANKMTRKPRAGEDRSFSGNDDSTSKDPGRYDEERHKDTKTKKHYRTKHSKRQHPPEDGDRHHVPRDPHDRDDSASPPQKHRHRDSKKHKRQKRERSTQRHDSDES